MEYVQERVATLHDYGDATPPAPTDRAAVVVPMTDREHAGLAAERVLSTLSRLDPAEVIVALRAGPDRVGEVARWIESHVDATVLWCNAPGVDERLREAGLAAPAEGATAGESGNAEGTRERAGGKGRDVWLALGVAARHPYVAVHDADATTYGPRHVPRLLFPLAQGFAFSKGYYARVENGRLYGRLFRLFVRPLLRVLEDAHDHPLVDYLLAFRYALAGEFAVTADLARSLRAQPGWGLEIGTLGEAYDAAGFAGSAQVDLGTHEHDHRAVGGPSGLGDMCAEVSAALFRALADHGIEPDFETLGERYRAAAADAIEGYAADAVFNGLAYDRAAEREQVEAYADAVAPPGPDRRLPAWEDAPLSPDEVEARSRAALSER
ncbi:MAG: glycosyl transferase family 2 [Haloarculaceae archaeon]